MKVSQEIIMINVENEITVGKGTIEATVIHQIVLSKGDDDVDVDIDFIDIEDVSYMGMKLGNDYKSLNKLKGQLSEYGVNFDELVDEECVGIISNDFIEGLKSRYKTILFTMP